MSPILRSLEFDHDEISGLINCEKINSTLRVLPIPKLFENHKCLGCDYLDMFA